MRILAFALLILLTLSTLEVGAQSSAGSGMKGMTASAVALSLPGGVHTATLGYVSQSKGAIAPSGRSNAEIMRHLYRERYEEPFWKR